MKRKVLCNKTTCALDRLPEQQFGGGISVQAQNYVIPLESVLSIGKQKGGGVQKRTKPKSKTNKSTKQKKNSVSRMRASKK